MSLPILSQHLPLAELSSLELVRVEARDRFLLTRLQLQISENMATRNCGGGNRSVRARSRVRDTTNYFSVEASSSSRIASAASRTAAGHRENLKSILWVEAKADFSVSSVKASDSQQGKAEDKRKRSVRIRPNKANVAYQHWQNTADLPTLAASDSLLESTDVVVTQVPAQFSRMGASARICSSKLVQCVCRQLAQDMPITQDLEQTRMNHP
ncbi:hypothetical protein B0H16DRAFT_1697182 [Mycena metata]|uniref:Uncharacterized protein n=1 Tax=Mycena metata TaxID=1033252 RepID=A0AAD7MS16_9AGAR|nr:hypothetical protein B0H16DRAFT_1697182 [Mycena metata]